MIEILHNARMGWLDQMRDGRSVGLLLVALVVILFLFRRKKGEAAQGQPGLNRQQGRIWLYSAVMSVVCILPVTAMLCMFYQTKFYDYPWIWSLVPVTGTVAMTGVLLRDRGREAIKKTGGVIPILLAVILILTGAGNSSLKDIGPEAKEADRVLALLRQSDTGKMILWAPEELMARATVSESDVAVVYGRNMWQEHLNAYTYDTYSDELRKMYVWMEISQRYGWVDIPMEPTTKVVGSTPKMGETIYGREVLQDALAAGVNQILLPRDCSEEILSAFEEVLGVAPDRIGEYYHFQVQSAE